MVGANGRRVGKYAISGSLTPISALVGRWMDGAAAIPGTCRCWLHACVVGVVWHACERAGERCLRIRLALPAYFDESRVHRRGMRWRPVRSDALPRRPRNGGRTGSSPHAASRCSSVPYKALVCSKFPQIAARCSIERRTVDPRLLAISACESTHHRIGTNRSRPVREHLPGADPGGRRVRGGSWTQPRRSPGDRSRTGLVESRIQSAAC